MRFGHGTWAGIIAERSRRIQKAKAEEKEYRKQKLKRREQITDTAVMIGIILGAVMIVAGVAVIIIITL